MEIKYLINCIYRGTEGEGIHIGRAQIFVRFQGCHIGCLNCDSKETWDFNLYPPMSFDEVLQRIEDLSHQGSVPLKRISITGGDPLHPLHHQAVLQLIKVLKERGFTINIEASGARVVKEIFDMVDFISFDYKTPSTHVRTPLKGVLQLITEYSGKFQIKAVVADEKDFLSVWQVYQEVARQTTDGQNDPWCLTPAYNPGEEFSMENFKMINQKNEECGGPFRVIGQQHKWIYGPDAKEV